MPESKDSSAPNIVKEFGAHHPINQMKDSIMDLLTTFGFKVISGPEIETEKFNFDMLNINKVIHQFFPIDTNYLSKKFINYWNPKSVFFIDSEISPNMIENLERKKIPINLINGRITKKTFKKWNTFSVISKKIFFKFNLCLA